MSRVRPLTLTKTIQSAFVLLMVVLCNIWRCGPGNGYGVRLYNECSSRNVRVDFRGRVLAEDETLNAFQNLTVKSLNLSIQLSIFAEKSHRYLCFNNKWSLVGSKRFRGKKCLFYEEMLSTGYTRYKSVANQTRYMGFNRKGRPIKHVTDPMNRCLNFLKLDSKFNIGEHNSKLAGTIRKFMTTTTTTTTTTSTTTTTTPSPPPSTSPTAVRHTRIRFRHHHRRNKHRHHKSTSTSALSQD